MKELTQTTQCNFRCGLYLCWDFGGRSIDGFDTTQVGKYPQDKNYHKNNSTNDEQDFPSTSAATVELGWTINDISIKVGEYN